MFGKYKTIIFFITITLLACNENLKLTEKDVVKYHYLRPFIVKNYTEFDGYHNLDSEEFQFSYKTNNMINTLSLIEMKTIKEGWSKSNLGKNAISYSKNIILFESKSSLVVVILKMHENDDRIYFKVK